MLCRPPVHWVFCCTKIHIWQLTFIGRMQHFENWKFQWHIRNELYPRIYPLLVSFDFFAVVVSSFKKQSKNLLTQWWPPILPALHFPKTLAPLPWCLSQPQVHGRRARRALETLCAWLAIEVYSGILLVRISIVWLPCYQATMLSLMCIVCWRLGAR